MRARLAFGLAVAANLVALYSPHAPGEQVFPGVDKVVHAAIFAAVLVTGRWVGLRALPLALVLLAHAVESELVQAYLLPARDGAVDDVLADWIGVALGLGVAAWGGRVVRRTDRRGPHETPAGTDAREEELLHE